jgi:hypothetical protein
MAQKTNPKTFLTSWVDGQYNVAIDRIGKHSVNRVHAMNQLYLKLSQYNAFSGYENKLLHKYVIMNLLDHQEPFRKYG